MTVQKAKDQITAQMTEMAISPETIARAVAFVIEQPNDVDIGDIVIRPNRAGVRLRKYPASKHTVAASPDSAVSFGSPRRWALLRQFGSVELLS
jgi:hypothetical protein